MQISFEDEITEGIPDYLPQPRALTASFAHAPMRNIKGVLSSDEFSLAISNALRYFPQQHHAILAAEFLSELQIYGRIYMYRYRPVHPIFSRNINSYPAKSKQAAAIMLMIQNNLDPVVAKYPEELITYGGNGAVFQNWAQYRLVMKYLSIMTEEQTLVLYSGHPLGLFPSHSKAPRVVVSNGMMIPNYSSKQDWNKFNALGVTQYGQMTAGSFMYIGPQGIVHGTTITLLNAGRLKGFGSHNLAGIVFVTSGLGGMSGAQSLASIITGAVGVIAEVDPDAIQQRLKDNYISNDHIFSDLSLLLNRIKQAKINKEAVTLIYSGNIVDLWEYFNAEEFYVELGSDQTSLHNIHDLGYCPAGYTFEQAKQLLQENKQVFFDEVQSTLRRHVAAINIQSQHGMYFWDYGNAFLKEAGEAGADVWKNKSAGTYIYPSYVEDIMGPMCFDFGFGPFRWVCTSGAQSDLDKTDQIAHDVLINLAKEAAPEIKAQLLDNINWIKNAKNQIPVVGSKSRILYADATGRIEIAKAFNVAISKAEISGPIVLGRDHHDVSGTDSPFRETSNIYDGSKFTADMAIHNVIGDSFRGATWVSIHNGGGVGWGEVINGGFGMLIDGSDQSTQHIESMLFWDVNNGIARRAWAKNKHAMYAIKEAMGSHPLLQVTLPNDVDQNLLESLNIK